MPALDLHSASGWAQRMKKRMSVKGELFFTQTCAGGCRGTGRRWRRTWGLVYDPWSSCRPPRSAGRSLPSLCRHRQGNTSQNMFQLQLNQNRIWHFEKSDFRHNETAYLHVSTESVWGFFDQLTCLQNIRKQWKNDIFLKLRVTY